METYLNLLEELLREGTSRPDRTGTGTLSKFGHQLRFDLREGFPAVTTKKLYFHGVAHELIWFLRGETNVKYLQDNDVHIWDEWADEDGELGPVYGKQWRNWKTGRGESVDQIRDVLESLRENPHSRRHLVSAWNPSEIPDMALPPCHVLFQFYVHDEGLSCHLYQRSGDVFLGVPFNIASYALLTHIVAELTDYVADELVMSFGDIHLYQNHVDQARTQLEREPYEKPTLELAPLNSLEEISRDHIRLKNYRHHPSIDAPIAV